MLARDECTVDIRISNFNTSPLLDDIAAGISECCAACPGPQIPGTMPTSIARQVRKFANESSLASDCLQVWFIRAGGELERPIP